MSEETNGTEAPADDKAGFENPVTVTIDGREIVAEAGTPLLQVALDNGVEIPHYCYHPKLSIDGSCRMCQVKVEKAPKLAIACNTPVNDGMVVDTKHEEVEEARRGVMELLLVNHPLDCPICDQAGECYLQDYSFGYGREHSRSSSPRRKGLKRHPIGERVVFDQERCILCRRCVRFTNEISKTDELRVFGIGDHSHIGTAPDAPLNNDYSVCTADICPVGALLSEDFHHKRRVWFLEETESVCPSCSKGCNVKLGMFKNEIQRLVPRRNDDVNETWMCDHGRLRYGFAHDESRVRLAVVRPVAEGDDAPAERAPALPGGALQAAAERLRAAVDAKGGDAVAVLVSGHLSNEEYFALKQLTEAIGTSHVDLVIETGDSDDFLIQADKAANGRGARDLGVPGSGKKAADIAAAAAAGELEALVLVGSGDAIAALGEDAWAEVAEKVPSLICIDATASALTEQADIVVPGQVWAEKNGTFTNHEGRIQRIRAAMQPAEGTLSEGHVFTQLAGVLAQKTPGDFDPAKTLEAIADAVPAYAGLTLATVGGRGRMTGAAGDSAPAAATESAPADNA